MYFSKASLCFVLSAAAIRLAMAFPDNAHLTKRQDWDPNGIICDGDSDCTTPGYPYCRCGNVVFGGVVGQNPVYTYLCASHCGADGCIPDCENCLPCS